MADGKRATIGAVADRHAADLARRLGAAIRDARARAGLTQVQAAARSGLDQTTWSKLERNGRSGYTLRTWDRAAHAVGTALNAYLPATTAADLPRDAVHLRNQELVLRSAKAGGWSGVPESTLDADLTRSRHGDVVLQRREGARAEWCLVEVVDWIEDVGESVRDFDRRLATLDRLAVARMRDAENVPATCGIWLLRATLRNRRLVAEHRNFFRGRFPGSSRAWLAALSQTTARMPSERAVLWVDVSGSRMLASRLNA